ncbi:hypothetical protein BN844_0381 [Pseudomonas sp. SHC52]|nr:hypothetical protein BN844_0381 [Pseudomonas sp. SHC52]
MEQPGGEPQHADFVAQQVFIQSLGVEHGLARADHQAATVEQRTPDFQGAGIEGRIGGQGDAVLGGEVGKAVVAHQSGDGPVRHLHAFGHASGTGGVHDVGRGIRRRRVDLTLGRIIIQGQVRVPRDQYPACHGSVQRRVWPFVNEQPGAGAILEQGALALRRGGGVDGHVGRTIFQDCQDCHDQARATLQAQRHPGAFANALGGQPVSQLLGALVELAVTHGAGVVLDRRGVGPAASLGLEEAVQRLVGGVVVGRVIEAVQHLIAFVFTEDRQPIERLPVIVDHGLQGGAQRLPMTLHGGSVEQGGGIGQAAGDHAVALVQVQGQVELGAVFGGGQRRQLQRAQFKARLRRVLPGEHDLEDRAVGQRTRRVQGLHHLLEGDVLVRLGVQGGASHLGQQLVHPLDIGKSHPQGLGVDEEADQRLDFSAGAVGQHRADHQVILPGKARQDHRPGGQHGHEQGVAMALAQLPEGLHQCRLHAHFETGAGEILLRRARPVQRQLQQRRSVGELRAPVVQLFGDPLDLTGRALPQRVVGVLVGQWRQRIGAILDERSIEFAQLTGEHAQ